MLVTTRDELASVCACVVDFDLPYGGEDGVLGSVRRGPALNVSQMLLPKADTYAPTNSLLVYCSCKTLRVSSCKTLRVSSLILADS